MLFSGHVTDALQALLDWLCWAELQLAEEAPVAGDRDLVRLLVEQHKVRGGGTTSGKPREGRRQLCPGRGSLPTWASFPSSPTLSSPSLPCQGFQKELGQRANCVKALRRSTQDLVQGCSLSHSQWLQSQVEELGHRWELVCRLSVSKQGRLEAALLQVSGWEWG